MVLAGSVKPSESKPRTRARSLPFTQACLRLRRETGRRPKTATHTTSYGILRVRRRSQIRSGSRPLSGRSSRVATSHRARYRAAYPAHPGLI
uniref:Uncharacterized protein n=1 Tax=uncultured marine virus TaxID=186617 RepID=A0A0F7L6H8_9VIRU|nr:hypothetical protein [uncultured marine virus]